MSVLVTAQAPSTRYTSSAVARDSALPDGDRTSAGTRGFDTVLASHAAHGGSTRATSGPTPETDRPDPDKPASTNPSRHADKAGAAEKASRDDAPGTVESAGRHPGEGPAPAAADASPPAATDAAAASPAGTPTGSGPVATELATAAPTTSGPLVPTRGNPPAAGVAATKAGATAARNGPPPSPAGTAPAGRPGHSATSSTTPTPQASSTVPSTAARTTGSGPVGTSSPGHPVGAATGAASPPPGTHATAVIGTPNGSGLAVPVLNAPVAMTPSSMVSAPVTGQSAPAGAPAQQVFTAVSSLLRGADGSYGVRLQLHPQDLGAVQVTVDVRHGEISIQMHATNEDAREALRGGLSDLRQQLEDQGLRTGSMEVGSGGADPRQRETSWARSHGLDVPRHDLNQSDQLVTAAAAASSTVLDLRM